MIACQGTRRGRSIGISNVMQRHFSSYFPVLYHETSLKGELVFDCSRKHLDIKMMFHNYIYAHRWPKLIKYQLHHHCTAHSVVNPINLYQILLLDRGYIYNFSFEILSNFNNLNDSD